MSGRGNGDLILDSPAPSRLRSWLRIGKLLFPLVVLIVLLVFLGQTIHKARADLADHSLSLAKVSPFWLCVSGLLYLIGSLPSAIYWHQVMTAMGQSPTWYESLRSFYIGHLGKYVPGKFMVILLRTRLIESSRTSKTPAGIAIFIETLTTMAVGALIATTYVAIYFRHQTTLLAGALVCSLAVGTLVLPPVFRGIVRTVKVRHLHADIDRQLEGITLPLLLSGWITIGAGWVIMGLSLWAAIISLADCDILKEGAMGQLANVKQVLPLLTNCSALAVVAGFVSMIPGGIGAREVVVTEMLPPLIGVTGAIGAAILIRIIWLLAELLVSVILYPIDLRSPDDRSSGTRPAREIAVEHRGLPDDSS